MRSVIYAIATFILFQASMAHAVGIAIPGKYKYGQILETGGSNFTMYDMGDAKNGGSWDGSIRPVIATYNQNPTEVESEMRQLFASGQHQIVLFLWYMPFTTPYPGDQPCVWVHVASSSGGQLCPQAQQNLQAILRLAKQIGFNEVTLRFGPQGVADPTGWTGGWNEAQYQENLSFIINTRNLMENELSSTSIRRIYDLSVEMGGNSSNQSEAYVRRLWPDYVNRYGKGDSYGMSVGTGCCTVATYIQTLDQTNVGRPNFYAIDGYGSPNSMTTILIDTYNAMKAVGDGSKPLIIQETVQNSASIANEIVAALNQVPLTIQHIDQWPVIAAGNPVTTTPAAEYNEYGGSFSAVGSLVAYDCVLPPGATLCTSQISWSTANATNVIVYVNGQPMASGAQGTVAAPWISTGGDVFELVSSQGVLATTTIKALSAGTPTLDTFGAEFSGSGFQQVTMTGSNFQSGCSVIIFKPGTVDEIGSAPGICQPNSVTFTLPPAIEASYPNIVMLVLNPNGEASNWIGFSTTPPFPFLSKGGIGGPGNTDVWMSAANVTATCLVQFYTPNWAPVNLIPGANPAELASVAGSCQLNSVAAAIPSWIQQKYSAVNVNVSDSTGTWSDPIYITITP